VFDVLQVARPLRGRALLFAPSLRQTPRSERAAHLAPLRSSLPAVPDFLIRSLSSSLLSLPSVQSPSSGAGPTSGRPDRGEVAPAPKLNRIAPTQGRPPSLPFVRVFCNVGTEFHHEGTKDTKEDRRGGPDRRSENGSHIGLRRREVISAITAALREGTQKGTYPRACARPRGFGVDTAVEPVYLVVNLRRKMTA
jgi:hypothetical protein